jgi:hypothetical protein
MIRLFDGQENRRGAECPKRSLPATGLIGTNVRIKEGWRCLIGGQYTLNRMGPTGSACPPHRGFLHRPERRLLAYLLKNSICAGD